MNYISKMSSKGTNEQNYQLSDVARWVPHALMAMCGMLGVAHAIGADSTSHRIDHKQALEARNQTRALARARNVAYTSDGKRVRKEPEIIGAKPLSVSINEISKMREAIEQDYDGMRSYGILGGAALFVAAANSVARRARRLRTRPIAPRQANNEQLPLAIDYTYTISTVPPEAIVAEFGTPGAAAYVSVLGNMSINTSRAAPLRTVTLRHYEDFVPPCNQIKPELVRRFPTRTYIATAAERTCTRGTLDDFLRHGPPEEPVPQLHPLPSYKPFDVIRNTIEPPTLTA